jgi:nucleoside-diphosphate-sugar epimerase
MGIPHRTLVTGATGILGRHLVESLVHDGASVRALARESSRTEHLEQLGVSIQRGDLLHEEDVRRAVRDVEVVFHLGAMVLDDPTDTSDALWQQVLQVNVQGSERIARLAAAAGVKRFVFCSSLRVFGFGSQMLWQEEDPRTPADHYGRGKALAEEALLRIAQETGLEVVSIRPRFVYGNFDQFVLPRLVRAVHRKRIPVVRGRNAICDMVYVRDCVQALLLAAQRPVAGQSYNITSGECLNLREILLEVARALGRPLRFIEVPAGVFYAAVTALELGCRLAGRPPPLSRAQLRWYRNDHHFSIAKARRELGYQPRYRLADALREIDLKQFVA